MLALPGALGCSPEALRAVESLASPALRGEPASLESPSDAESALASMRWSLLDLAESVLAERPVLVLLDNLQWLDDVTANIVGHLRNKCRGLRLMWICTTRESTRR